MRWRGPMIDATVSTVATVVMLAILTEGGLGSPEPGAKVLDGVSFALVVAAGAPLAVARRWPAAVFGVSALATIVLLHLRYPLDLPLAPIYAGYVLALAWGGAGPLRRTAAVAGVVAFVPVVAATLGLAGVNIWAVTTELSTWGLAMVGVWLAAERARLRQAELDAAEERASRSEREAERENRLAAAEERTRIARELHDSAGHAINVILVQAGAARLLHERDPGASLHAISTVEEVARATIVDIDRMVHALRSADGQPVPADPAAFDELIEHHRRSGLQLATTFDGERRPLPRSVAWAAYRILQEALTNAARHGSGSAEVVVGFGTHAMEIAVSNRTTSTTTTTRVTINAANRATQGATTVTTHEVPNNATHGPEYGGGPGTPPDGVTLVRVDGTETTSATEAHRPIGGHGLIGMRERATLLGGTFVAAADAGTFRVRVRLPYDATRAS